MPSDAREFAGGIKTTFDTIMSGTQAVGGNGVGTASGVGCMQGEGVIWADHLTRYDSCCPRCFFLVVSILCLLHLNLVHATKIFGW